VLWEFPEDTAIVWQGRIGNGKKEFQPEERFPRHWKYNPFTGDEL